MGDEEIDGLIYDAIYLLISYKSYLHICSFYSP